MAAAALTAAATSASAGTPQTSAVTLDDAYAEIQRVFGSLDHDRDGLIRGSELPRTWQLFSRKTWVLQLVDPIRWLRTDLDGDGRIVAEDVISLYRARIEDLDRNGDTILTHREWVESSAEEERHACARGDCEAVFEISRAVDAKRRQNGRAFVRLDPHHRAAYRFNSGLAQATYVTIRDYRSWHRLWDRIVADQGPKPASPGIDFSREMVLVAAMGARPTGGYRIQIISVLERSGEIVVTVVRTSPGRRCGTIQAVTEPVDIVRTALSSEPVRWDLRDRTSDCP